MVQLSISNNNCHIYQKQGKKKILHNLPQKLFHNLDGTILECILLQHQHQHQHSLPLPLSVSTPKTLFIADCLQWKQTVMTAENFQFRWGWLMANAYHLTALDFGGLIFKLVQYFRMDCRANLERIYQADFGYQREGLKFIHYESPYIHGYNPNSMIWKDQSTSKYPINQQSPQSTQSPLSSAISGTGILTKSGLILSLDGYHLGYINPALISAYHGGYIKYQTSGVDFGKAKMVENGDVMMDQGSEEMGKKDGDVLLRDFQVLQYRRFSRADPLSKIIFQYRIRNDPLTIEHIASRIKK